MKKILVFTDSLGLPRKTPETVLYNETWVYLLSEHFDLHQISIGGGVIDDLFSQIEYAKMFEPDYIIIQAGIVDCAPRAMTKMENHLLNKFWITRVVLKKIMTQKVLKFLRKKRKKTYTDKKKFENRIKNFLDVFEKKLYWIEILPAGEEYEKIVPGIAKLVEKYNNIIEEKINDNFISLKDIEKVHVMTDNIHLSKDGHSFLFKKIMQYISNS